MPDIEAVGQCIFKSVLASWRYEYKDLGDAGLLCNPLAKARRPTERPANVSDRIH